MFALISLLSSEHLYLIAVKLRMRSAEHTVRSWLENLMEISHLCNPDVEGIIILKWMPETGEDGSRFKLQRIGLMALWRGC